MQSMIAVDRDPKAIGRETAVLWPFDLRAAVKATIQQLADNQASYQQPNENAGNKQGTHGKGERGNP
jgi:hypothetical protein